jgi:hypothetical protein
MPIEYLPGVKPGAKIDLNNLPSRRFEKKNPPQPETYLPPLKLRLVEMSERLNDEYGYQSFFSRGGQIAMTDRAAEETMTAKEEEWAAETGKKPEDWRSAREKDPAAIAEMALTLLFDKILHKDFIVARASAYDDYENGADQLIINKKTGAVVCGLDDVLGHQGDDGGEKKEKKIDHKMKAGGATIKYGATVEHSRLVRKDLRHVPLFYFSLSKEELNDLLPAVSGESAGLSNAEQEVFAKLVDSLAQQSGRFSQDASLHPRLQANLQKFGPSLAKMLSYKKNL